ncbi:MAG: translocation/assembly module TamB domain-containing protein [Prevotella sp.]|nr:translocation/assembly module TamB domain-containing protein [Prevotella sp.]
MKKALKWMAIAVLTPILLFLILAALLYLPPVQNWAVKKVAAIASEKTGMEITVGHVNLEWPLDLGIDDFRMLHPNDSLPNVTDTIADVGHLTADIQLWPLLKKRVVINELSLQEAKLNTNGFISDLRIKGRMKELWLSSKGIDLDKETAEVNGARLADADLDIQLSDTAAVDTTSDVKWIINADSLSIHQTHLTLHLPGDTLNVDAYMGHAVAKEANIDLGESIYQVSSLRWSDGRLKYDNRFEPNVAGLDYNHIALTDISLGIDSISYTPAGTSFYIHHTSLKEKSGLEVTDLKGGVRLDSAFNKIQIPALALKTPDSDIYTEVDMDFSAFGERNPGQMKMRLNAQLGKQDLMRFMGDMPASFIRRYPNHPISIKGSVNGNMREMEFTGLDINLPTAFHLSANGTVGHLTEMSKLQADLKINAKTQDIGFMTALLDAKTMDDYRIPNGISLDGTLKANGPRYTADLIAREGQGTVKLKGNATIPQNAKGEMVPSLMTYDADISIKDLNLHHFMPKDSIYTLSADIAAKGYGTDILSKQTHLNADATLHQLKYGSWDLNNMTVKANVGNGRGKATITGHNALFIGDITADMLLAPALSSDKTIEAQLCADLAKADLFQLRITDEPLTIGLSGDLDIKTDLKNIHYVSGLIDNISIQDDKTTYYPTRVGLLLKTNSDTTYARIQSGDFIVKLDAQGGYERVMKQLTTITDSVMAQYENRVIDQQAIKRLLPTMKLHVESKKENPIANLLKTQEVDFKDLLIDLDTSPETGINGSLHLYSLNYDSTRIDTIYLHLTQKGDRLTYQGQIRNNRKNPQFVFNALIDGHVHEHGALAGLRYYDKDGKMGVRIGATAEMEPGGIRFKLMPDRPTLGYKEFNLNKDNFIFLGSDKKIQAKVDLISDDKTGLKLYTENQDSTMLQDLTLSCNLIDLGEITSVVPYLPKITGKLNGDYHILQDQNEKFSVVSDMAIQNMTYEGAPIGNISTELVYLMKEDDTHAIEGHLMLNDEEFGTLSGNYQNKDEGNIDATFNMTRFPLSLVNGFITDQIVGLEGFAEGELAIKGTLKHPKVDGELYVEDAYLVSLPYGIRMRFDNDPVRVIDSRLLLENFGLYAYNDEPINMMGNIDFSDTERITMDMRMRARNLLLINSKQEAKSIAFGKAYVNFAARIQGPLEQLDMRGRLDVLSSTDMTYMLLDSPLSTDNRLDELVKFTDFSDSTQTVVVKPVPTGLNADFTISVAQGAHIVCDLNVEQTNYIDLMGSGDLRMKYNYEGIHLTGRYTLNRGEMKYSLPVIPLKTFTIKDGSYVEFTGDAMNPKLNITATERIKASVNNEGASRVVAFDCGVIITKTLNDMGLQFIIEAPEDNLISGDLNSMTTEERGKVAVAMLTTGMYLADSNTSGFSMNAALSSFLQSEINNIAGSALKTLDLSVGIDNTTDATGAMQTDYSFKFAKRFFDNRLKIELGGVVSSGANTPEGQKQSFFDNVSMEYRMNQSGTMNAKIFYQQNVYDWLDGYTNIYGGGFVWRRKLSNFWDIFQFWKKEQRPMMPRSLQSSLPGQQMQRDSLATDSVKVNR